MAVQTQSEIRKEYTPCVSPTVYLPISYPAMSLHPYQFAKQNSLCHHQWNNVTYTVVYALLIWHIQ